MQVFLFYFGLPQTGLRLSPFVAGVLPGFVIDGLAPVVSGLVGARMPTQAGMEWLSIMPVAESRSSYNGLLGFLFIVFSASMAAFVIHRFASRAIRRAPAGSS